MLMFLFLPNQNSSQHDVGKPLQVTYSEKTTVYSIQASQTNVLSICFLIAKGYHNCGCALTHYISSVKQKPTFHVRP